MRLPLRLVPQAVALAAVACPSALFAQGQPPTNPIPTTAVVNVSPAQPTTADSITLTAALTPSGACSTPTHGFIFTYGNSLTGGVEQGFTYACPTFSVGKLPVGTYQLMGTFLGTEYEPGEPVPQPFYGGSSYSGTFTVTQAGGPGGAAFKGQYAVLFEGTALSGQYTDALATFTADGDGSITAGTAQITTLSGTETIALTGSYTLDTTGRGTLNLVSPSASFGTESFSLSTPPLEATSTVAHATMTAASGPLQLKGVAQVALQTAPEAAEAATTPFLLQLTGISSNTAPSLVGVTGLYQASNSSDAQATVDETYNGTVQLGVVINFDVDSTSSTSGFWQLRNVNTGQAEFTALGIDAQHFFVLQTNASAFGPTSLLAGAAIAQ